MTKRITRNGPGKFLFALSTLTLCLLSTAEGHFQLILPGKDIVPDGGKIALQLLFTHPMENGPLMNMARPRRFGVQVGGGKTDLLASLKAEERDGKTTFTTSYAVKEPGDHIFYLEPAPYWEPAEGKMILHYTKVIVNAFGQEKGWETPVGLPVEIEPLVRPYGLWTGNLFRGIVRQQGQPVPFAEIEVEYLNTKKKVKAPADPFVTQVIKADQNGTFSYAMPKAGWWGFAALIEGAQKMKNPQGKEVAVELGGLLWVQTMDMK